MNRKLELGIDSELLDARSQRGAFLPELAADMGRLSSLEPRVLSNPATHIKVLPLLFQPLEKPSHLTTYTSAVASHPPQSRHFHQRVLAQHDRLTLASSCTPRPR